MIKTDNDIFYLSAGEACYIFKVESGALMHVYFGKRVEPEDDLSELGLGQNNTPELDCVTVSADGKTTPVKFVYEHAEVSEEKPTDGCALIGEKTLIVTLADKVNKLKAKLLYTPYPRGGFTRSVVLQNESNKSVTLRINQNVAVDGNNIVRLNTDGKISKESGKQNAEFFAAVTSDETDDAYGFLCAYADGKICAEIKQGAAVVTCRGDDIKLSPKSAARAPELLKVYSDTGLYGMTRVTHDILRESLDDDSLNERSPAILFLPKLSDGDMIQAVKSAYGMGFGVVALDGGQYSDAAVKAAADECREQGITLGLRYSGEAQKGSMLYGADIISALKRAVTAYDIKYLTADAQLDSMRKLFTIKNELHKEFPDLRVEFGTESDGLRLALIACYPVGCLRNIISLSPADSFKQRFDCATMGTLGYEFDPNTVADGLMLAVRAQKQSYQDDALTVVRGDIYRQGSDLIAVSKDKSKAYAVCKTDGNEKRVRISGLDEHNLYNVREIGKTFSGAALMYCGVLLPSGITTHVLHLIQVADFY